MTVPNDHLKEGLNLTAEALIDLYEISLTNVSSPTYARFRDGPPGSTTSFGGYIYEHVPLKFSGVSRRAEEEKSRPTLTVVNPEGVWNKFAMDGNFDRATLLRKRALKYHLDSNTNLYQLQIWFIARVTEVVTNQGITFELRSLADGPDQLLPVRKYMPDEGFPFVTLR